MKLNPLRDHVVIKQAQLPEKVGGIHLPDHYRKELPYAEVLAVGPDVKGVSVGDNVYFHAQNGAIAVPYNEEMVIIIKEEDVSCIVEGAASDIITNFAVQH